MKTVSAVVVAVALLAWPGSLMAQAPNTLTPQEKSQGWQL